MAANRSRSSQGSAARAARAAHPSSAAILPSSRATGYGIRQSAVRGRGQGRPPARIDQIDGSNPDPTAFCYLSKGQGTRTRRHGRRSQAAAVGGSTRRGPDRSRPCKAARSWQSGTATRQGRQRRRLPVRPPQAVGSEAAANAWRSQGGAGSGGQGRQGLCERALRPAVAAA